MLLLILMVIVCWIIHPVLGAMATIVSIPALCMSVFIKDYIRQIYK